MGISCAAPLGAARARRRTFTSAFRASAHCMSAALRHPACACSHSPALGHGQPRAPCFMGRRFWSGRRFSTCGTAA